ncbi:hypothetical protein KAR91_50445 [Candidatus Pacearchaeota archaeon]|nr:hypothetical protein [Candidatus Pacearchaeota archaeon]
MTEMNPFFIGDGATVNMLTDKYPATVIATTPQTVTVRRDKAIRTDNNGMSESQSYRFEPDPDGAVERFNKRKDGRYHTPGARLSPGRDAYHDFSF